jgi:hypothetical protein
MQLAASDVRCTYPPTENGAQHTTCEAVSPYGDVSATCAFKASSDPSPAAAILVGGTAFSSVTTTQARSLAMPPTIDTTATSATAAADSPAVPTASSTQFATLSLLASLDAPLRPDDSQSASDNLHSASAAARMDCEASSSTAVAGCDSTPVAGACAALDDDGRRVGFVMGSTRSD